LDLIISLLPGLNAVSRVKLLETFCHEEELFIQTKSNIERLVNIRLKKFWDINEIRNKADRIDTICRLRSIKWVSWTSADYPPLVREINDPPSVLYYRGCLPDPEKSLLGMVGTRRPSPEAAAQAYDIALGAGQNGISVVSGLAFGIDTMSHRGNLAGGVPGYAVLGSGADEIYPSSNRQLAKKILDSGGALISEYPPGVRPNKWTFPARNRIIAGLSRSVLIVEAPQKSGALITADLAHDYGRDLWAAFCGLQTSGCFFDKRGTEKLVQDGAEIIFSEQDILEKWNMKIAANENKIEIPAGNTGKEEIVSSMAKFLNIEV
jgi:DNA processing protein